MIDIKLNKNYKITTDKYNYILWKKRGETPKHLQKGKSEKIGWKEMGFFMTLEDLYEDVIECEIKLIDAKNFREALNAIKSLKDDICPRKDTGNGR